MIFKTSDLPKGRPIEKGDVEKLVDRKKAMEKAENEIEKQENEKVIREQEKKKQDFKCQLKEEIINEIKESINGAIQKNISEMKKEILKERAESNKKGSTNNK